MTRMQELVEILNQAAKAYYQESREIMSNFEYDKLYDELEKLEKETGIVLAKSPTINVGYEVLSELPKEAHDSKMLSLDKTKDVDQLAAWLEDQVGLLSWKLDGLTVVLTYENGELSKAVTRGNGEVGEVVTNNAKVFENLPRMIPFKGKLVLRGEAVISYRDFEIINATIDEEDAKYKNPRNLCAGSVRQLNNQVTAGRHVRFYGFNLVSAEGLEFQLKSQQQEWLMEQGFQIVKSRAVTAGNIHEAVKAFSDEIYTNEIPSDGLVLTYDNIDYGLSLGQTAKFPRHSIAFKWQDEVRETELLEIEWSASRTGLINPVAIFKPVELEGTTVSRASVHNISVMKDLKLGIGDKIMVYKANMIIPQIAENLTGSGNVIIPETCPVCGKETRINSETGVETLYCANPDCMAKQIKSLTLFVSRDAMDIEGLSEMTLEKFTDRGMIKELADIYRLDKYKEEIVEMEGFGEKSFANLIASIEKSRQVSVPKFLYALGVPNIGVANAKLIAGHCKNNWEAIANISKEELLTIDGVGEIMAEGFVGFFKDEDTKKIIEDLLLEVSLDETFEEDGSAFEGITFVITGSLNHFENRDALKAEIESNGGKVAGSVSSKTNYLINNNIQSNSSKNKKARELGIEIIDEEKIVSWLNAGKIE